MEICKCTEQKHKLKWGKNRMMKIHFNSILKSLDFIIKTNEDSKQKSDIIRFLLQSANIKDMQVKGLLHKSAGLTLHAVLDHWGQMVLGDGRGMQIHSARGAHLTPRTQKRRVR